MRNAVARRIVHAREQRAERERLAKEIAAKRAQQEEEEEKAREEAMKNFGRPRMTATTCLAGFREKASSEHPEVPKILEAILAKTERERDARVPFVWTRSSARHDAPISPEHWALREKETSDTFRQVVAETCPAEILGFTRDDIAPPIPKWGLFVEYAVEYPKTFTVRRRGTPGETITVEGVRVVFEVRLVGPDESGTASFRLTMPAPDKLAMAHRPASIFVSTLEDDGTYDERVYESMSARAFDRLYDELWSLFFSGAPRVPLDRMPTSTHTGADP
jgi:hypothetical protein